jgi:predicted ATP-grasp superfamily ATP-dependent carboligase
MRVLITDAHDRKALAAVRSLGRLGRHVWVAGTSRLDQAFYSRYCGRRILHPDPRADWGGFADILLSTVRNGRCSAWLPMSDHTTVLAARHRDELDGCVGLAVPGIEAVELAKDKPRLLELAARLKLRVPATFPCETVEEALAAGRRVGFPCIVKPQQGAGAVGVHLVRGPEELRRVWKAAPRPADPVYDYSRLMVQEFVPGAGHSVSALLDHGRPVAAFSQKRVAAVAPLGGLNAVAVSTHEPALRDRALELLQALSWHGPSQVQFIMDERDGLPTLMEVNGRFWGSLDLAARAGVDFVRLAHRMALGRRVKPCFCYEAGVAYRWWIPHCLMYVVQSGRPIQAALLVAGGPPGSRRMVSELRSTDPFPAAVQASCCAGAAVLRGLYRAGLPRDWVRAVML